MKDLWLITYLSCQDVSICKLACYVHRPQWSLITEVLRARHAFSKWFTFSTHLPKLDPSKELCVCLWLQKKNQLKDQPPYWLWNCAAFYQESFFCLYPHSIWSPLMWLPTATYLEMHSLGTSPWRFYLSWNSQRMYLACEAHGVPLQSSNLISIGGAHHSNMNQGFFSLFSSFFLISSHWQFFCEKIHKLIQIHTRKSKVWNYISERKKHWCWPSALSMYSTNLQSFFIGKSSNLLFWSQKSIRLKPQNSSKSSTSG